MIGFERAHEENVKKAEARARMNRAALNPRIRGVAGPPPPPDPKVQNIDEVVNQLRSGAFFRQRRKQAAANRENEKDKDKDKEKGKEKVITIAPGEGQKMMSPNDRPWLLGE